MRIQISEEEAADYLTKFFLTYPGVKRYIEETKNFAETFGFTYTFTGRRRRFPIASYSYKMRGRVSRQAVNARIQSTSSDVVQTNLVDLSDALKSLGGRVLLTVHDSIVFQAPKSRRDEIRALTDRVVLDGTKEKFPWLPVPWKYDVGRGPNYGEAHDPVLLPLAA